MKPIWIIALNTYREVIRDRILYAIFVFAVLLIGMSLVLGELSFAEQARITTGFGLSAIQIGAAILSIFLGSTLVTKEIEKKTIMTLLVRPVSRAQFLLGKAAGLLMLQITVMTALALVLIGIFMGFKIPINEVFLLALHGVFLEASVLLGLTLFFSVFATPMMVVAFSLALFLIGHWLDSLLYFTSKSSASALSQWIGKVVVKLIPNLEQYNWRSAVIHNDPVLMADVGLATVNALAWFLLLIGLANLIFRRKEFA